MLIQPEEGLEHILEKKINGILITKHEKKNIRHDIYILMSPTYSPLSMYEKTVICETCLTEYKQYNMKWNNYKIKCIVNDSRNVVLYTKMTAPLRIPYKDIKRIELRKCMKLAFVLTNKEILISGFRRKSVFNHLKRCLLNQVLVIE